MPPCSALLLSRIICSTIVGRYHQLSSFSRFASLSSQSENFYCYNTCPTAANGRLGGASACIIARHSHRPEARVRLGTTTSDSTRASMLKTIYIPVARTYNIRLITEPFSIRVFCPSIVRASVLRLLFYFPPQKYRIWG